MREKRYKLIAIASEALGAFFNMQLKTKDETPVPMDIELVNVRHGFPNQVELVVYHPSFEIVPEEQPIPYYEVRYNLP